MSFERDEVELTGGVRHGVTMGGPVAIRVMAVDPVDPDELASLARNAPLTRPRPGHADLEHVGAGLSAPAGRRSRAWSGTATSSRTAPPRFRRSTGGGTVGQFL